MTDQSEPSPEGTASPADTSPTPQPPLKVKRSRLRFDLVPQILLRPRAGFRALAEAPVRPWLTPLLLLTLLGLVRVIAQSVAIAASTPPPAISEDAAEFMTEEDQASLEASLALGRSPIFTFFFPALGMLFSLWMGWLVLGALMHLALTLTGGRSEMGQALNITAWALLPFGVQELVRAIYFLISQRTIISTGLGGVISAPQGLPAFALVGCLSLVTIYLIWHVALLLIGFSQREENTPKGPVRIAVGVVMLAALTFQMVLAAAPLQIAASLGPGA